MSKQFALKITNNFQNVRLVSLASWRQASEFSPRDRGGPYVVTQEGYDPQDLKMSPDEFVLGRSGQWLPLSYFFKMPVADRRALFVFGTVAEVMQMMEGLRPDAVVMGRQEIPQETSDEPDEMATAFKQAKGQP